MASRVQVVIRFRPINKTEEDKGSEKCVDLPSSSEVVIVDRTHNGTLGSGGISDRFFTFDGVLPQKSRQEDLFTLVGMPTIDNVLKGYNGTILAYGQTGSGKTHSMLGPEGGAVDVLSPKCTHYKMRGVIPRIAEALFDRLEKLPEQEVTWRVTVNVFELYKEMIQDLLTDGPQQEYRIREDTITGRGIYVENLYGKQCKSASELLEAVKVGSKRRKVASTRSNETSSRSHSLTLVTLEQVNHVQDGTVTSSRLNLIDLAGSERVGKTEAQGERLKEAQMINLSLTLLGNVIYKLTDGKSGYIPYRNSKLTRLLQESFGGNSVTTLLCHASPALYNKEETISTLRFASRAKQIKNKPRVNRDLSLKEIQLQYAQAIDKIRMLEEKVELLGGCGAGSASVGLSPNQRREGGGASTSVDGTCTILAHEELQYNIANLLCEMEDVKKDIYEKEEDLAIAKKQMEFYKQKATDAENEAQESSSKIKRDEGLFQCRLLDLKTENDRLVAELASQMSSSGKEETAQTSSSIRNKIYDAGNIFHDAIPVKVVDAVEGQTIEKHIIVARKVGTDRRLGSIDADRKKMASPNVRGLMSKEGSIGPMSTINGIPKDGSGGQMEGAVSTANKISVSDDVKLQGGGERSHMTGGGSNIKQLRGDGNGKLTQGLSDCQATAVGGVDIIKTLDAPDLLHLASQGIPTNLRSNSSINARVDHKSKPEVSEIGITAHIGRSETELLIEIDQLEKNVKQQLSLVAALNKKDKDKSAQLERLGNDLEQAHLKQDDYLQELDSLKRVLEAKEKENVVMKSILDRLNIDIDEQMAMLGSEQERNAYLKAEADKLRNEAKLLHATQEQQEYCEMAAMELIVKTEDVDAIENELGYMSYAALATQKHASFQASRASCMETIQQLNTFLDKLIDTMRNNTFNTSNLESQRLAVLTDSLSLMTRVESSKALLEESQAIMTQSMEGCSVNRSGGVIGKSPEPPRPMVGVGARGGIGSPSRRNVYSQPTPLDISALNRS